MDLFSNLLAALGFTPQEAGYAGKRCLIWLHIISDGLIAISYFVIPVMLFYLLRRRKDLKVNWMFLCFLFFIMACGATHLMEIWNIWRPVNLLAGVFKGVTAVASIATAAILFRLMPQAAALPSNESLIEANRALQQRTAELIGSNVKLKQLAAACQRADTDLQEAQRLAQVGSWEWLAGPDDVTWSEELYRIFGRDRNLPPPSYHEYEQTFSRESWIRLQTAVEGALQKGTPYELDLEFHRSGGDIRWLVAQGECVHDADGKIVGLRGTVQDITERRWVAGELEDLYDHAPCGYHSIDQKEVFVRVNETELSWLGFARDEMIGKMKFSDLLSAGSKGAFEAIYSRVDRQGWVKDLELELIRKDGTILRVLLNATATKDADGKLLMSHCNICDITERMWVEEIQRKQAQLLGLAHDAIFVRDAKGDISYWNAAAERCYGWSRQEAMGKHADTWLHTLFPQPLEQIKALLFETDHWEGELTHTIRDGSRITVESRWSLQRDSQGEPTDTLEIDRDITEREYAKQALMESEERFRFALDGSPITVFNHDRQLRYSWVHNAAQNGYQDGDCIGLTDAEILGGEEGAKLMAIKQGVIDTGIGIRTETSVTVRGDRRFLDLTVEPLHSVEGWILGVTCTSTDVTALRRVEQQVSALNADLERRVQERTVQLEAANQELEAFSSSISHDLRAPLRRIDGFSRILLEDYADKVGEAGADTLNRIRASSQNMAHLIEDLLNLSRVNRSTLRCANTHLGQLARSVADELQALEPERRVKWVIAADAVALKADVRLLRVVFENLLGNAWKFTRAQADPRIEFGETKRDGALVWFVRDNGAGFDMAYSHKLFSAFQRLHSDSEFPGTGIGLATVRRIIHRHGGQVWAEGEVGKGATFYFTLPS